MRYIPSLGEARLRYPPQSLPSTAPLRGAPLRQAPNRLHRQLPLHKGVLRGVEAALQAIDHLQAQGVKFVTVRELFACKGVVPACGKLYRMAK